VAVSSGESQWRRRARLDDFKIPKFYWMAS
jgi:hypothetical protein